tara:strand:+ start:612 stop:818 length:207 start_codon:yes stop_codon:yes gene_type:complete
MIFRPTIVVVYKRKWGSQKRIKVFTNFRNPDPILEDHKGKYIPATAEILDIGVGQDFIELYKKKHKIK